ncbi:hypothetical protein GCM10009764_63480 [Nocardia ninae]|uniref:Uncharacterized protein n=1 Tax=Nocardia ninae NBRC 108245 TaxID=1210091 RepID=A0A511MJ51_9NOCA|nr:hypothetical protein NN4_51830 [Nocardia ninae NBRC 108245]
MPAIVLTTIGGPRDDMRNPQRDLVVTPGAAVHLHRTRTRDGANNIGLIPARPRLGPAEDITERRAARPRAARVTVCARFPTRHAASLLLAQRWL